MNFIKYDYLEITKNNIFLYCNECPLNKLINPEKPEETLEIIKEFGGIYEGSRFNCKMNEKNCPYFDGILSRDNDGDLEENKEVNCSL